MPSPLPERNIRNPMKKHLSILVVLVSMLGGSRAYAQDFPLGFWVVPPISNPGFWEAIDGMSESESIAYAASCLEREFRRNNSCGGAYLYLAKHAPDTYRDQALALSYEPTPEIPATGNSTAWRRYLDYQELRGWFKDPGARAGMDSVYQFTPDAYDREQALKLLSQAAVFTYFEDVRDYYLADPDDSRWRSIIASYVSNGSTRQQTMDFFDALVATTTTADDDGLEYLRLVSSYYCGSASRYFFEDSTKARDLMEFMIENRDGELRKLAFDEVDIRCSTAKERFAWLWRIVPTELDPALREHYLDRYTDVSEDAEPRNLARWDARDGDLDVPTNPRIAPLNAEEMALEIRTEAGPYLSPYGISLLVEWYGQEPDTALRDELDEYLENDFQPLLPLQDDPVSQHLDELVSLVDSMQTYAWVAPATFAAELQTELAAAQAALSSGDSTGAANQIAHFQATMQAAYEYPVTGVHEATREGHRFLWWTAEYLRNRLPDVADVPVLSLLPAAATFVSDALNPQFVGTTFRVYGREHDIGGQTTGSGDDRHGIVTTTAQATQDILDALAPDQTSRVRGSGPPPDVVVDTPVLDIAALVDQFFGAS